MLHPEQVDGYADRAVAAFDQLNGRILRDMARHILEADYTVTASALWQAQRAKAMGASTSYLIRQFAQLAGVSNKAAKVFAAAMLEADRQDKAGLPPQAAAEAVSLQLSPAAQQIAQSGFRRTMNTLRNLTRTRLLMGNKNMVQTHQAQLGRILDEGHLAVVTGAYSSEQVIRRGLEALAAQGVGACTYPSGHVDTLETVVRRAMVTGINQTAIDISLHNARQLNCRFMELSAHSGARTGDGGPDYTNHSWWQGQIVSLDGEPGYLSLKDIGYGDVRGFGGANCRHNWHLFWPGISTPAYTPEALAEYNAPKIPWQGQLLTEEQARQKQRALERRIRRAKRECIVAEEWGVPSKESAAKARLARARARLNAYLEETGLKMDEGRTEVAKGISTASVSDRGKGPITQITDSAIDSVPCVSVPGFTDEQNLQFQNLHKELLRTARKDNSCFETAFIVSNDLERKKVVFGTETEIFIPPLSTGLNSWILHNHPRNSSFSTEDLAALTMPGYSGITIAKNNGGIEMLTKSTGCDTIKMQNDIRRISKKSQEVKDSDVLKMITKWQEKGWIEWTIAEKAP